MLLVWLVIVSLVLVVLIECCNASGANTPKPHRIPQVQTALEWVLLIGEKAALLVISLAISGLFVPLFYFSLAHSPVFTAPYGVLASSFAIASLAVLIALPIGTLAGVYLHVFSKGRVQRIFRLGFAMGQSVPAVFFGLVGALFLVSVMEDRIIQPSKQPLVLIATLGVTLGFLLALFVANRVDSALKRSLPSGREAALALGFTASEAAFHVQLAGARQLLASTLVAAFNRAFGETMIVLFLLSAIQRLDWLPVSLDFVTLSMVTMIQDGPNAANWGLLAEAWLFAVILAASTLLTNELARRLARPQRKPMK
jgi:phosphate transport system permease protein